MHVPMEASDAEASAAADTTTETVAAADTTAERELRPHRPEYSDVGFLSEAEMKERRQRR